MSNDPRRDIPREPGGDRKGGEGRLPVDADDERVRDFFARERAAAPTLSADPRRWQRILEGSARRRRANTWYAAWAAAAAVVVVAGGVATLGRGSSGSHEPAGPVSSPSATRSSVTSPSPSRSTGPSPTPTTSSAGSAPAVPVPSSFTVSSLTTGAPRRLFALGTVSCPAGRCPALTSSSDDGTRWRLVHTFPASTAGTQVAPGRPGSAATLTQVRFASASVGWVFGGGAMRTTDGGATWQDYPHPGGDVIGLETDGTDVVLTTAPGCRAGTCHGTISVVRAPVSASSATDVLGTISGGAGVEDAVIGWQGGQAFVSPVVVPLPGQAAPAPVVVAADGLHRAAPTSCGTGQPFRLVTAAAGRTMFAVCLSGGAAGHLGYAVQASSDGGASWRPVPGQPLLLANAGTTSFAAADARTLLAVSGGSPDLHGSMTLSSDGGATWRDPRSAPALPNHGWAWVGSPGGGMFYALSGDGTGAYWRSTDRGDTWSKVAVAGP